MMSAERAETIVNEIVEKLNKVAENSTRIEHEKDGIRTGALLAELLLTGFVKLIWKV